MSDTKTILALRVANIENSHLMENNQQQILSEIKALMTSVRSQLEELDIKIAQWQQMVEPEELSGIDLDLDESVDYSFAPVVQELSGEDSTPIVTVPVAADFSTAGDLYVKDDVEDVVECAPVDVAPVDVEPVEEAQLEEMPVEVAPVEEEPVEVAPVEVAPVEEELVEVEHAEDERAEVELVEDGLDAADDVFFTDLSEEGQEPILISDDIVEEPVEDLPVQEEDDDLPFFDVPQEAPAVPSQKPAAGVDQQAVIDLMAEKYTWRTAIPGTPVKDIRGAIALNDRVLFINHLFGTDPMAFQDTLNRINQMQTFEEAVNYLATSHPEWDFNSNIVYNFMMAVRRKVN